MRKIQRSLLIPMPKFVELKYELMMNEKWKWKIISAYPPQGYPIFTTENNLKRYFKIECNCHRIYPLKYWTKNPISGVLNFIINYIQRYELDSPKWFRYGISWSSCFYSIQITSIEWVSNDRIGMCEYNWKLFNHSNILYAYIGIMINYNIMSN